MTSTMKSGYSALAPDAATLATRVQRNFRLLVFVHMVSSEEGSGRTITIEDWNG